MTGLLRVTNLLKLFPVATRQAGILGKRAEAQLHAVDKISFDVERGETVGLVGESGCGKSTLVRLVTRLIDPTSGSINFADREIGTTKVRDFGHSADRGRIQMVLQDANESINPRFTAFHAIADPLKRIKQLHGAALKARVEELAGLCGLPQELLSRYPHQLSGGQKARVGIARAIAVEPELLVLDEPTSALDVSVQVVILRLLDDLKRRLGMSYLFVSHDLNVIRLICDRVLVMYLGKIVESGPTEAIFRAPAHPYTKALISAIPDFVPGGTADRQHLSGEPRSPIDPNPNVCRFYGRCPKGQVRCATDMPQLVDMGEGRRAACHYPEIGAAQPAIPAGEPARVVMLR